MKNFLLIGLLVTSSNVFASKLQTIDTLSNATLESVRAAISKIPNVTHETTKKVLVLKGAGKTPQEVRMNTVAQALHTVCPYFDDAVSVGLESRDAKGVNNAVEAFLEESSSESAPALTEALTIANKQVGVEIYSGSASGNNTDGTVLGIYDVKNNEIAAFASTNCGSDD
ncbi:MAG: hypothetical protein H7336_08945 [Bacteriovorax sp.]|nr:hypothetical protein [Bacteriovorax sp.]